MGARAFTPSDLARAVEAATKRGCVVERAKIDADGGIELFFAKDTPTLEDVDLIDWRPKR